MRPDEATAYFQQKMRKNGVADPWRLTIITNAIVSNEITGNDFHAPEYTEYPKVSVKAIEFEREICDPFLNLQDKLGTNLKFTEGVVNFCVQLCVIRNGKVMVAEFTEGKDA